MNTDTDAKPMIINNTPINNAKPMYINNTLINNDKTLSKMINNSMI